MVKDEDEDVDEDETMHELGHQENNPCLLYDGILDTNKTSIQISQNIPAKYGWATKNNCIATKH